VTATELKAQIELERRGVPFLMYRTGDGEQRLVELTPARSPLTIGRRPEAGVSLAWDTEVSRLHSTIEQVGSDWVLVDDGLSRNGSFVNGTRVIGRHRLEDGDRLCFGETVVLFRCPGEGDSGTTGPLPAGASTMPLTPTQRRVLIALCRPVNESAFATPATNREIAEEVFLSVDAVKAHLRTLFERFGLEGLPQNQKRARLAASVLVTGLLSQRDF
jgi:pSer/pThr/pTyr-binding forkhead associated (FHA) protein